MKILISNVLYSKTKDFTRIEYIPLDKDFVSNSDNVIGYHTLVAFSKGNILNQFDLKDLITSAECETIERKDFKDPLNIKRIISKISVNGKVVSLV